MSVNREKHHFLILPEDMANERIANGFFLLDKFEKSNCQILPAQKGWPAIRDGFLSDHNSRLIRYPKAVMVLLVDFDNQGEEDRIAQVKQFVDPAVANRVFVLGAKSEPERLKRTLGSYEKIGKALAKDCLEGTTETWDHELLVHNRPEIARMQSHIDRIFNDT